MDPTWGRGVRISAAVSRQGPGQARAGALAKLGGAHLVVTGRDARHDLIVMSEMPTPPPWWTAFISEPEEDPALDPAPAGADAVPKPVVEEPSVNSGPADI